MSSDCLACKKHVRTGDAALVVRGTLKGEGEFVASEPAGLIHTECLAGVSYIDLSRQSVTIKLS